MGNGKHEEIRPECRIMFRDIREKLDAISQAVMGNGDPQKGLASRVGRCEVFLRVLGLVIIAVPAIILAIVAVINSLGR